MMRIRMLHNGTVTGVRRACSFLILYAAAAYGQRFVILGDRTGSVQPGVWEQVWRETAGEKPAFVVTVGDMIEQGFERRILEDGTGRLRAAVAQ